MLINERAQTFLTAVVERYIRDGQPVSSKTLAEEMATGLSPATIRNILSELEERGYLRSPHTSAGRVPTAQGYRFFVNALLTAKQLTSPDISQMAALFHSELDVSELITSASNMLSDLTHMVGLVMLPKREHQALRHIEFLPLAGNRILVVLVLNGHEVQNRVIHANREFSLQELQQAANYLNSTYVGQDVVQVRKNLLDLVREDRQQLDQLTQTVVEIAGKALKHTKTSNDYVLAGQSHVFQFPEFTDLARIRQLFEMFTQKQDVLHLLDQCLNADGMQIFIGEESGFGLFDQCSLVTAPYSVDGQIVGALGVIGPTRMSYNQVIPIVDVTAKLLTAALNPGR